MRYQTWGIVIVLFVCVLLLVLMVLVHDNAGEQKYNGGVCMKCGGRYTFFQIVTIYCFRNYAYVCENCGDLIETGRYYGQ